MADYMINPFNMFRNLLIGIAEQKIQKMKNQMIPHFLVLVSASVIMILTSVYCTGIWQFVQIMVQQLISFLLALVISLLFVYNKEFWNYIVTYVYNLLEDDYVLVNHDDIVLVDPIVNNVDNQMDFEIVVHDVDDDDDDIVLVDPIVNNVDNQVDFEIVVHDVDDDDDIVLVDPIVNNVDNQMDFEIVVHDVDDDDDIVLVDPIVNNVDNQVVVHDEDYLLI